MYLNGYIPIRRGQATSAVRCMNSVARAVKRGWRVIFFAEGTRSGDEFVHPFKTGVAYLVTEHHLPVLPVAIFGSHALLPRASLLFRPGTVRIAIGPELSFDGLDPADRRAHVRHMRTAVADLHGTIGGGGVVGADVP
jgi:1-acyl-sn-glycerol-3-phosphate acyltransferase